MPITTHIARIVGPLSYTADGGTRHDIPLGPCLVEQFDGDLFDIVWGASGESSAKLSMEAVKAAAESGHLVLIPG